MCGGGVAPPGTSRSDASISGTAPDCSCARHRLAAAFLMVMTARSTAPAPASAKRFSGGSSGIRGLGFVGAPFFAAAERLTQVHQLVATEFLPDGRKERPLFFSDVVPDALHQH